MDSNPPLDGIIARDVTVTYRNGHTALREASFAIPRGTITALVGVNGAGKSTLFKAIMGFVPAARGEIALMGKTVREALKSNMVAYVPQAEEVDWAFPVLVEDVVMMGRFGHMSATWREGRDAEDAAEEDADATLLQMVIGYRRILRKLALQVFWDVWRLFKNPKEGMRRMRGVLRIPSKADHLAVDAALDRVNMRDFRHRQIGELSGGQRKRVFLARALAQDGKVILLDEPFTGVDVKTEDQIIALLRELRDEGRVMLVSTHNLGSVPEFCDRTVLVKGTVLAHGLTEEVFTHDNLEKAFGGVLRHFTLSGEELHDDDDPREVMITTDDERPFVRYGVKRGTEE